MKKHHYFITGTSRGIGAALAEALLSGENLVHCFSRSGNPALVEAAAAKQVSLFDHKINLSDTLGSARRLDELFAAVEPESVASITLVQNAGLLHPMGKIGHQPDIEALEIGLKVNLLSPMLINEQFVARFQQWPVPKKILNISTGAARNPYIAWNMYCSSKAGLDMHSRVLAAEQDDQLFPVKVLALAPGIVDTSMQDLIRAQTEETFPMVDKFVELKEEGLLVSPSEVAGQIIRLLQRADYGQEVLMDLRA